MYCTNCGHELAPEAKFCSNCGAPVSTGASAEPVFETPAERRERERQEDFTKAWGSSSAPTPPPADNDASSDDAPTDSATRAEESSDRGPSAAPQDDVNTFEGGFATRSATWEVERAKLRSGDLDDEWSMSDLGPPKPQRRRTWLWVLLGLLVLFVLVCIGLGWWLTFTDGGKEFMDNVELQLTQTAEALDRATESPATPQP